MNYKPIVLSALLMVLLSCSKNEEIPTGPAESFNTLTIDQSKFQFDKSIIEYTGNNGPENNQYHHYWFSLTSDGIIFNEEGYLSGEGDILLFSLLHYSPDELESFPGGMYSSHSSIMSLKKLDGSTLWEGINISDESWKAEYEVIEGSITFTTMEGQIECRYNLTFQSIDLNTGEIDEASPKINTKGTWLLNPKFIDTSSN